MARQWRIEYEGAFYHVLSRGNERRSIFWDDKDRHLFLEILGKMSNRFSIQILAYVLMPNHYHLLIKTPEANLSKALQWLGVTYTRRFNNRHNRSGHLFQGRFKSFLVENESYLVQLSCYIHRNPLRAGLVHRLADYQWSSYLAYAYGKNILGWLRRDVILSYYLAKDPGRAYRNHVQQYAKEESRLWENLRHGLFLGSEGFAKQIQEKFLDKTVNPEVPQQKSIQRENPKDILEKGMRLLRCDGKDWLMVRRVKGIGKEDRDLLIYLLWSLGHYRNEEISELFGLTYSAVSHCVREIASKFKNDTALKKKFDQLNSQFKM